MGIRDALKSLRGADKDKAGVAEEDITAGDAPEPTWFQPRFDGSYIADLDPAAATGRVVLRFLPGGKVFETPDFGATSGTDQSDPCRGDYTAAGRFNVQRKFERLISYAVLEMEPAGFLARRINSADRSMAELHFIFRPGQPAE